MKKKKDLRKYETKFNVVNCGAIQAAMDIHNAFVPATAINSIATATATANTTADTTHTHTNTINSMHHHIAILNFASAKHPGGGYLRGASAQEESLCRSSLLYPCIQQYENRRNHYYQINRGNNTRSRSRSGSGSGGGFGTFYSNCAIFSPLVPIIRDDGPDTNLLEDTFLASFVTSPAPNMSALIQQRKCGTGTDSKKKSGEIKTATKTETRSTSVITSTRDNENEEELQSVMVERIKRILKIFHVNDCTDLVLGAFGCGVFGNDPEFVAAAFHRIILEEYNGHFRSITFAIWTPPKCLIPMEDKNYSAFMNEFSLISNGSVVLKKTD